MGYNVPLLDLPRHLAESRDLPESRSCGRLCSMTDEARPPARQPIDPVPAGAGASRIRPRLLLLTLAAVLTGVVVFTVLILRNPPPGEQPESPALPFDARLVVAIDSADRSKPGVQLDEPRGALPVRAGEWMRLTVQVTEPAYCYCLRIDGDRKSVV